MRDVESDVGRKDVRREKDKGMRVRGYESARGYDLRIIRFSISINHQVIQDPGAST